VAAAGSAVFFALAPGVVAGVVPWYLTGWYTRRLLPVAWLLPAAGSVFVAIGVAVLGHAFVRYVAEGLGTPAPVAPTDRLVVGGPYRYVRNPMYLAVVATIIGQALILGQSVLLVYTGAVAAAMGAFAHGFEEPFLTDRFGDDYLAYRRAVPAWRPRLHPWTPDPGDREPPRPC
jgi:protein-S-isoprenylcysteine O-methyltransferase Ste14